MVKKIFIVLVGIFLLWVVANVIRVRILTGRAAILIQAAKPFERVGTNKQKILVLGDSLGYGTGVSSPEKSVAGLVAAHYPDADVKNLSVNGKRTKQIAEEVNRIEGKYDLILVIVGGNDILRPWINLDESGKHLETIYTVSSENSHKVIALTTGNFRYTTFFLPPLNLYFEQRSISLRDHALKAADKLPNVTYVNMVERNKTVPFDHLKEAPDHLHLSDDGAKYWYEAILASKAL